MWGGMDEVELETAAVEVLLLLSAVVLLFVPSVVFFCCCFSAVPLLLVISSISSTVLITVLQHPFSANRVIPSTVRGTAVTSNRDSLEGGGFPSKRTDIRVESFSSGDCWGCGGGGGDCCGGD